MHLSFAVVLLLSVAIVAKSKELCTEVGIVQSHLILKLIRSS